MLLKAEPLEQAATVSRKMADVERTTDGALLLNADPAWVASIKEVLASKDVRVSKISVRRPQQSTAA
ncbi:MAG: hypothetical protein M3317_01255 [Actinomycetota bacterium]|nr:hypothetical protein [Actinomycetota bacterium]